MGQWYQRRVHGESGRASCSSNSYLRICFSKSIKMDAIRKKMQSLKSETDSLYSIIHNFEEETKESNRRSDQADCDIRDYGKKVHGLEIEFDETCDKLQKATESLEEKEKMYREVEGGGQEVRREPGWHCHQACHHIQGGRQHPEEGEGRREHLHEQRGHPGGAGQELEGIHQDGCGQRAEAGRAEQEARCAGG